MKASRLIVNMLKHICIKNDKKRYKDFKLNENYKVLKDISYLNDSNPLHKLDVIYASPDSLKKNCTVIDIHGGAYIFGKRQNNYGFVSEFVDEGYNVILIDYEYNNGKISNLDLVKDCVYAISYIMDHLDELGLANNFIITGDSAGGHLALLLSEMACSLELSEKIISRPLGINVKCCLLSCPVFDYVNLGNGVMTKSGKKRLLGTDYNNLEVRKLICPKTNLHYLDIPLFLSTCKLDFIRSESLQLKEAMANYKNKFKFIDIDSDNKEIGHVHNVITPELPESKEVNKAMIEFMNEVLRG